ncbi:MULTISPECIES: heptaprenyl diphosphate synthase component 1 [Sporosarcina]|uniref:Heptaprenyl diphosphate synthase component 1 n=1 Tax=Sporosarcina contaminans TaxID=633403 RepID=A0ABW3U0Z1_9BACL
MDRQTINRTIQNYIQYVENAIREPIVEKALGKASIDEVKAFFMLLPHLNGETYSKQIEVSAVAVGAVHAAFAVHDKINLTNATSQEQQLMVLSGDHYSGIHYRLLSSLPDFAFIRSMSETIGHINETKTNMMRFPITDNNELLNIVTTIEAACVAVFYRTYGFEQYRKIAETALSLHCFNKKLSVEPYAKLDCNENNNHIGQLEQIASTLAETLRSEMEKADFLQPFLKREIQSLTAPLLGKLI